MKRELLGLVALMLSQAATRHPCGVTVAGRPSRLQDGPQPFHAANLPREQRPWSAGGWTVADMGSKSLATASPSATRRFVCFTAFCSARVLVVSGHRRVWMVGRSVSRQLQLYFLAPDLHLLWG